MSEWIKTFYAVITPFAIGIFTTWDKAEKLSKGVTCRHKKFKGDHAYNDALEFI